MIIVIMIIIGSVQSGQPALIELKLNQFLQQGQHHKIKIGCYLQYLNSIEKLLQESLFTMNLYEKPLI